MDSNNKSIFARITPKYTVACEQSRRDDITRTRRNGKKLAFNCNWSTRKLYELLYNNNDEEKYGAEQISRTQNGRAVINFAFLCQGSSTLVMYKLYWRLFNMICTCTTYASSHRHELACRSHWFLYSAFRTMRKAAAAHLLLSLRLRMCTTHTETIYAVCTYKLDLMIYVHRTA